MKKILILPLILVFFSCVRETGSDEIVEETINTTSDFEYSTISSEEIAIQLKAPNGDPMAGVLVSLWTKSPAEGGEVFLKLITNESGKASTPYQLPASLNSAILEISAIGFPHFLNLERDDIINEIIIKGFEHQYTELDASKTPDMSYSEDEDQGSRSTARIAQNYVMQALGSFNSQGVPDYLVGRDEISASLLEYINASLPEGKPVPTYHPKFLANNPQTNLDIEQRADVWMTFVHEGAGYRNELGYYTYPTGNPPASVSDIDTVFIAFPNTSFVNSGGGLVSGDKVKLGTFSPGISIGFVLLANGWNAQNSTMGLGIRQVYSHEYLNPEPFEEYRQHNVLLWDEQNELFLLGFEDLNRYEGSDNDFNDAVFYITSNPIEAISTANVNPVDTPKDTDQDGVNDVYDEFPENSRFAYSYVYPGENTYGSFAFEDQWPGFGDYDFNDLVVDYQFTQIANALNQMIELHPEFIIRAIGAGYNNGFGIEIDMDPTKVASVSGSQLGTGLFTLSPNGTEAAQSKTVIIATDDAHRNFGTQGMVNTNPSMEYLDPDTINLTVVFASPQTLTAAGSAPFNPFLVINQTRGRELHLPGYNPTDLVDTSYFGQGNDASNPGSGIYYRSAIGLPWGMNLPETFEYPSEKTNIKSSYVHFGQWANSMGFSYMDWYQNKTGYRNIDKIYRRATSGQ